MSKDCPAVKIPTMATDKSPFEIWVSVLSPNRHSCGYNGNVIPTQLPKYYMTFIHNVLTILYSHMKCKTEPKSFWHLKYKLLLIKYCVH